jgi:hypothetical protein
MDRVCSENGEMRKTCKILAGNLWGQVVKRRSKWEDNIGIIRVK